MRENESASAVDHKRLEAIKRVEMLLHNVKSGYLEIDDVQYFQTADLKNGISIITKTVPPHRRYENANK